jgi:hypothetical protein
MKKTISTEITQANKLKVIELLASVPDTLVTLSQGFTAEALTQPLKHGERSFVEIVAHILNCDERMTESIYATLLLDKPIILNIHPEIQWGSLLHYEKLECMDLLTYLKFRRKVLVRILYELVDEQWKRTLQETGKQRQESVYWRARAQALHEAEHITQIETRFTTITP